MVRPHWNPRMNRRNLARGASALALGLAASRLAPLLEANDRIGIGFIGVGGMGAADLQYFLRSGQVEAVAIADPFAPHLEAAVQLTSGRARPCKDFRQVLDRKDIDAVVIATPDHWHAIPTIMACEAGKDVFVEKPLSHTVHEGRRMVEAAEKHRRVVQVGTQQRSTAHFQHAVDLVRNGSIGRVTNVETWLVLKRPAAGFGNPPDTDPPLSLDWDLWLGPAPYHVFNPNRCIQNFRWFWDYSNGMLTDWGVHLIDVVHWAMGVKAPKRISFAGGKYALEDNTETPDTFEVLYEYPACPVSAREFLVTFRCRLTNDHAPEGLDHGIEFFGTEGTLLVHREGFTLWPEPTRAKNKPAPLLEIFQGSRSLQHQAHVQNFLDCVRSRQKPNSDVETTHRSTSAPLLGVIAQKAGRRLQWDAERERFVDDVAADALLTKEYRKPWIVS
jgi:predicted dehydrogenase